jgi:hypothetical protein
MGKQLLQEGLIGAMPFIVDRAAKPVVESRNGVTYTRIPGRFSICDSVNGNNRRYPRPVWEKNLAEGSPLRQMIARNAAFGLLEHPKDGQVSLNSPICILVTDAKLQPGSDKTGKPVHEVVGEITLLNPTLIPESARLSALIEVGYNPLVSSRGFGSVIKDSQGVDEVQDDYICEGWDVVMKPSFETAELSPARESAPEPDTKNESSLSESTAPTEPATNLKVESAPSPAPAPAVSSTKPQQHETVTMDITSIKSRIGALRSARVPTEPQRFAEGLNEMATLHQEVANFVAEDAKRSWEGTKLHDAIKGMEALWSESAQAPAKQASRLTESYKKALRVTRALAETAVGLKKKLVEKSKLAAEAGTLVEQLTERGQKWVAYADKLKTQNDDLDHKLNVACESLDIIAARYHEDVTELGRRVITLEFKEQAQTEEIQTALKEAKKPKDIAAIREKLEPKPAKTDESVKGAAPAPAVTEGKTNSSAPAPEAKPADQPIIEARVLVPSTRSLSENVEMVKRLSASAK